jgi:hypothetical protein
LKVISRSLQRGSGGYAGLQNIDPRSREIYFTKQDVMAHFQASVLLLFISSSLAPSL